MKAKDLILRVVNKIDNEKYEIKEFKPYIAYESFVSGILADTEILMPTGIKDKDEKMIYEGDYIGIDLEPEEFEYPMCVGWDKKREEWALYIRGSREYSMNDFPSDVFLIIGNEYTGFKDYH